jgi:uncharacterized damage-inducible protein DinB
MTNSSVEKTDVEQLLVKPLPATDPAIGRALWLLEGARGRLKETLETLDPKLLEWEPYPGGSSISTVLYHIALIEIDWLCVEVLEEKYPPALKELLPYEDRDENGKLFQVRGISLSDHLQALDKIRQYLLDSYAKLTLDDFRRLRHFSHQQYAVTPEWVLFHLTQHETEHRGQIQEILAQAKTK